MPTFPTVSKADWLAKVEQDLKGKPLGSLDFEVAGARLSPFWHPEDLATPPATLRGKSDCLLGVKIDVKSSKEANRLALEALAGGANYLYFYDPHGKGDRQELYEGILTDIVEVVWHASPKPFLSYPVEKLANFLFDFSLVCEVAGGTLTCWLNPSGTYLADIAAIRALRLCHDLILAETGATTNYRIGVVIKGDASNPNAAKISATTQATAAMIGGADILLIEPSDATGDTAFERRIARNVHHLLVEESYLNRVADPAAGSYFLENLTDQLARQIWSEFQTLC